MLSRRSKTKFFHPEGAYVTSSNLILAAHTGNIDCQVPGIPLFSTKSLLRLDIGCQTTSSQQASITGLATRGNLTPAHDNRHPLPRHASVGILISLRKIPPLTLQRGVNLRTATQTALSSWHNTHLDTVSFATVRGG